MKLIPLTNVSESRLRISEARLSLEPGETKRVHPATAKHPAVAIHIGGALSKGTQETTVKKAEPTAPVAPPVDPDLTDPSIQPNADGGDDEQSQSGGNETDTAPADETDTKEASASMETEETPEDPEVNVEESDETVPADTEVATTDESGNLRDVFLAAPGITDRNLDQVLEAFGSIEELAAASKNALKNSGVHHTQTSKVLNWAKEQL